MMKTHKLGPLIKSFIITLLTAMLVYFCFNIYIHVDDIGIRALVSGLLSEIPECHNLHMNSVVALLISFMCYLTRNVIDFYGAFVVFSGFFILWAVLYRCFERAAKPSVTILSYALVVLLFLRQIVIPQYTVVAALYGYVAVFIWATSKWDEAGNKKRMTEMGIAVVFIALSYGIREETFIMMVPTLGLLFIYKFLFLKKSKYDYYLLGISIAVIGIMLATDSFAYKSGDFNNLRQLDKERVALIDYGPMPEYNDEEYNEVYKEAGITEEELYMITNNGGELVFCKDITKEKLNRYTDIYYSYNPRPKLGMHSLKIAFNSVMEHFAENKFYLTINIICFVFAGILFVCVKRYKALVFAIFTEMIMFVLWLYLGLSGRFLDRILFLLHFQPVIVLIALIILENKFKPIMCDDIALKKKAGIGFVVIISILLLFEMINVGSRRLRAINNETETSVFLSQLREDKDNYYLIGFTAMWEKFALSDSKSDCNYAMCYQWLSIMPQFKNKVCDGKYDTTSEAVVKRDDLKVVLRDEAEIEDIEKYYHSIGMEVTGNVVQICRINEKKYVIVDFESK